MGPLTVIRLTPILCAAVLLPSWHGMAQTTRVACFPANKATDVNPDTHLVLTFFSAPTLGKSGQIRIYDAADHSLVDTLDLSIPAGPDPTRRIASPPAQAIDPNPATPTTTTPAVRTTPADLHNYQLTTIGGLADFHFYPVIIHGNVATIYPHNNVLRYRHKYIVQIDPGVFTTANGVFAGFTSDTAWTFTTKAASARRECYPGRRRSRWQRRLQHRPGRRRLRSRQPTTARDHLHQEWHLRGDRLLPRQVQSHLPRRGS